MPIAIDAAAARHANERSEDDTVTSCCMKTVDSIRGRDDNPAAMRRRENRSCFTQRNGAPAGEIC
jgi:hypothetical protein